MQMMLGRAEWWQRLLPLIYHHWSYCGGAGKKFPNTRRLARLISATCSFHRICLTNDALSLSRARPKIFSAMSALLSLCRGWPLRAARNAFSTFLCGAFCWCVWEMRIRGASVVFFVWPLNLIYSPHLQGKMWFTCAQRNINSRVQSKMSISHFSVVEIFHIIFLVKLKYAMRHCELSSINWINSSVFWFFS